MELKLSLCSIFVCLCAINSVSSVKYEHVSDCYYVDGSYFTHGFDELTLICGEDDHEDTVFTSYGVNCSNIGENVERGYTWLGEITFQDCRLPTLTRNYFKMFVNMKTFNISNVELETMDVNVFHEARNVSTLDVSHNKLTEIPSRIFVNSINLTHVDFSHNSIKRTMSTPFLGATNLKTLNLSNNQLGELDRTTFQLPNLLTLDLSNNAITELPAHIFDESIKLKRLNLSYNAFGNVDAKTFSRLFHLEHLDLKQTGLSLIELGTFSQQHLLTTLDLSGNKLSKLDFRLFSPVQHNLLTLNLGNNQLSSLDGFRNAIFPRLISLDIQNNNFICAYLTTFMESISWQQIHLDLDINSVNIHHSNVRGISCDDSEETPESDEAPSMALDPSPPPTQIAQSNSDRCVIVISIALTFICVAFILFIVLYVLANLNQICSHFSKPLIVYQQHKEDSSKDVEILMSNI